MASGGSIPRSDRSPNNVGKTSRLGISFQKRAESETKSIVGESPINWYSDSFADGDSDVESTISRSETVLPDITYESKVPLDHSVFDFEENNKPFLSSFTRRLARQKRLCLRRQDQASSADDLGASQDEKEYFKDVGILCKDKPELDSCEKQDQHIQTKGHFSSAVLRPWKGVLFCAAVIALLKVDMSKVSKMYAELNNGLLKFNYDADSLLFFTKLDVLVHPTTLGFLVFILIGGSALYALRAAYISRLHQARVMQTMERIVAVLGYHEKNVQPEGSPYLTINETRDRIVPLEDRQRLEHVWNESVNRIHDVESRGRVKFRETSGGEKLWRWVSNGSRKTMIKGFARTKDSIFSTLPEEFGSYT